MLMETATPAPLPYDRLVAIRWHWTIWAAWARILVYCLEAGGWNCCHTPVRTAGRCRRPAFKLVSWGNGQGVFAEEFEDEQCVLPAIIAAATKGPGVPTAWGCMELSSTVSHIRA